MTAPLSSLQVGGRVGTVLAVDRAPDPDTGEIIEHATVLLFGPAHHPLRNDATIVRDPELVTVRIDGQPTGPVRSRHHEARLIAGWLSVQKRACDSRQQAMLDVLVDLELSKRRSGVLVGVGGRSGAPALPGTLADLLAVGVVVYADGPNLHTERDPDQFRVHGGTIWSVSADLHQCGSGSCPYAPRSGKAAEARWIARRLLRLIAEGRGPFTDTDHRRAACAVALLGAL